MQYKLVAIDLDDTLLDRDQGLSPEAISTVRLLEDSGVKVIIATGRMLVSAMPYIKELGLSGPMITYNGAYVKNISDGTLLFHQPIRMDLAREIIDYALENDLHINIYQDDQLYVAERNRESRYYEKTSGVMARVVGSLQEFIDRDVIKLLIVELDWQRKRYYMDLLKEKFSSRVTVTESKKAYIEFMAPGVSKGRALRKVAENLGIKREEVIAIGDSWNDLEMIEWAGLGIVMEGSPEELKKEADLVALPPDRDGVPLVLKEIFGKILDKY
ncbi:MAG: hypothetical protein PWR10_1984 [Halanaerobiales bacterium]|nr:hypothetical protein [Halanaerobiales bacterium]